MRISEFRITNFRSIVDTGWNKFSTDGITVLVGQNESGKTSILDAIGMTLSSRLPTSDDIRIGAPYPEIFLRMVVESKDLLWPQKVHEEQKGKIEKYLTHNPNPFTFRFYFAKSKDDANKFVGHYELVDPEGELEEVLQTKEPAKTEILAPPTTTAGAVAILATAVAASSLEPPKMEVSDLADLIFEAAPNFTSFQTQSGLLPNSIDIGSDHKLVGEGANAANNYLIVTGLKIEQLVTSDLRTRSALLKRANEKITKDFGTFWSQTIGQTSKLLLECELQTYGSEVAGKAGSPYLVFWISDGLNKLYPKQRSLGVRWFISFYLQLKASETASRKRFFLLDEPGANLHSKAQTDVLRLINKLSKDISIVYSTHSPHMIEYDKLYRVHAVQRIGDQDDSPTEVIDAHRLGAASTDTLSPILTAMGVDISHQQVIKKSGNVLLEEMSGYYYLTAFWELLKEKKKASFIAATGVGKVETLANMFQGWGLEFIVAVDDDSHGRQVFNSMKRQLFGDDDGLARKSMVKLPGCKGIEDVFSIDDFNKFIMPTKGADLSAPISEFLKTSGLSKPVLAFQFLLKVRNGEVQWNSMGEESKTKIQAVVTEVASRLP